MVDRSPTGRLLSQPVFQQAGPRTEVGRQLRSALIGSTVTFTMFEGHDGSGRNCGACRKMNEERSAFRNDLFESLYVENLSQRGVDESASD